MKEVPQDDEIGKSLKEKLPIGVRIMLPLLDASIPAKDQQYMPCIFEDKPNSVDFKKALLSLIATTWHKKVIATYTDEALWGWSDVINSSHPRIEEKLTANGYEGEFAELQFDNKGNPRFAQLTVTASNRRLFNRAFASIVDITELDNVDMYFSFMERDKPRILRNNLAELRKILTKPPSKKKFR